MIKVFGNLHKLENVNELEKLSSILLNSEIYKGLCSDLKLIIGYWKKTGQPPTKDYLLNKGVKYDDEVVEDIKKYLEICKSDIKQKLIKEKILELSQRSALEGSEIVSAIAPLLPEKRGEIVYARNFKVEEEYKKRKERSVGLKFFVNILDEEIGGLSYGTVTTLAGFTAHLKTTCAVNLAYSNANYLGYKLAYLTLEVPKEELQMNLLSRHCLELDSNTKITAKRIKKALLTDEEELFLLTEVVPSFREMKGEIIVLSLEDVVDVGLGSISEESFKSCIKRLYMEGGLDGVIVDYINLMKYFRSARASDQGVNSFIAFFHDLCISFEGKGLIGIILAQINREGWLKAIKRGGRYSLNALAEFNQLEMTSYYIVTQFYDEQLRASGEVKMQLLKHRSGDVIEEPFTVVAMPENFFVGDMVGYRESFTPEVLDDILL